MNRPKSQSVDASRDRSPNPPVIVSARKFDGREHRRWHAQLVELRCDLIVLDARFAEEVQHELLGTIPRGTLSREYYWLNRWYNIFRFSEPSGELRNYYCNINAPPDFDGYLLSYTDLDMDVLVAPDFSYSIVDEDEFKRNSILYNYPLQVRNNALCALDEVVRLIKLRHFPFDT